MKKLIISLAVLAGVCSCEHTAMEDAMCSTTYYIENQTDASFDVDGHTIQPGDKLEISRSSCLCGVKTVPKDEYYPWEMLAPIKTIIAGEKQLPDIIYRRRYWTYSHAKYYDDTYTLAITDEFIDKIGPYTSTYMLQNECSDDILVMWLPGPGADHAYASGYIQAGEGTTIFSPSADMGFSPTPYFNEDLSAYPQPEERLNSVLSLTMGGKQIIQYYDNPQGTLFENDTYTLVSETPYERTYEFTFTDEFFADGEPIE